MFRTITFGNSMQRGWADSLEDALLSAIDAGIKGLMITHLDNSCAPSSWRYFTLIDDIEGVSKSTFNERMK